MVNKPVNRIKLQTIESIRFELNQINTIHNGFNRIGFATDQSSKTDLRVTIKLYNDPIQFSISFLLKTLKNCFDTI